MKTSLRELYVDELRDLLSAEKQLTKAIPKMAKAAYRRQVHGVIPIDISPFPG
jgi:ferritin-like metal-binding protein YciE